jgi:DNA-binding MarR family transcriptional regulator
MTDNDDLTPPADNIRTLLYKLGLALDERLTHFRRGTPYETARPSDVRVFVRAAGQQETISQIARALSITRQAVQTSVQRLQKLQVLDLEAVPGNKRDKLVVLTPRGVQARKTASEQIKRFENEISAVIGEEGLATLRKTLITILESTYALNQAEVEKIKPPG